jgi:hypothetical protein
LTAFGSWDHAERLAIGELMRKGWSRLVSLVGGHVASFGDVCYQTDTRLSEKLRRPDGRAYHPESIARARRWLRDAGVITSERVFVGAKLPNAKWRSSRGTTIKTFNWRSIEQKNPFSRRQQRQRRQEQAAATRATGEAVPPPRPRHMAPVADHVYAGRKTELDPELARIAAAAQAAQERNEQRRALELARNAGNGSSILRPPPERPPPD